MKKLKAKLVHSNFQKLENFDAHSKAVYYECELDIGFANDEKNGSDRFSLVICNIDGVTNLFNKYYKHYGFIELNHVMIFSNIDKKFIIECLSKRIESVEGDSWGDIVDRLSIFLKYEFAPNVPQWEEVLK